MKVTYIYHSGFLVDTGSRYLLFDYYRGRVPKMDPNKPLYIFASHVHHDHFDPAIFRLPEPGQRVQYILSDDIPKHRVPPQFRSKVEFIGPQSNWDDSAISIETLLSTDEGVAFWVRTDGFDIYHAGDLNDWFWENSRHYVDLEQRYLSELARIQGRHADVAFVPVDPRLEREYYRGVEFFTRYVDADAIFPMHLWGEYGLIDKLRRDPRVSAYRDKIEEIREEGQEFLL